jgi:transposase
MRILYKRVAGLDVHKKTVVATRMRVDDEDRLVWETKTFGTTTPDLLELHDWLQEWACTHVAMESTGDYWKPVFNLLEGDFTVVLVNAQHVKHVPGRKTDVQDAEWLAELMLHGLLKPSFIPPPPQRALRDLTRYRTTVVQERVRVVNRVQKLLEGANIKLTSVVTDVMGVSAREMLAAIIGGETDAVRMADLAHGRLRNKLPELEKALTGRVQPHHRFLLAQQLAHIDFLDEQIAALTTEIERQLTAQSGPPTAPTDTSTGTTGPEPAVSGEGDAPAALTWLEAVALLDTHLGISDTAAAAILAEIGLNVGAQFPTPNHLTAWAGLAPGNNESAGKRHSGRTRPGNHALQTILVEVAWAAIRVKDSFLRARYHRLAARRGKKRAIVAIARTILANIWYMLTRRQPYQELGGDYFDQRKKDRSIDYHIRQVEKLTGGTVVIEMQPATA